MSPTASPPFASGDLVYWWNRNGLLTRGTVLSMHPAADGHFETTVVLPDDTVLVTCSSRLSATIPA